MAVFPFLNADDLISSQLLINIFTISQCLSKPLDGLRKKTSKLYFSQSWYCILVLRMFTSLVIRIQPELPIEGIIVSSETPY